MQTKLSAMPTFFIVPRKMVPTISKEPVTVMYFKLQSGKTLTQFINNDAKKLHGR